MKFSFRSSRKISGKLEGGPFLCLINGGDGQLLLFGQSIRGQRTEIKAFQKGNLSLSVCNSRSTKIQVGGIECDGGSSNDDIETLEGGKRYERYEFHAGIYATIPDLRKTLKSEILEISFNSDIVVSRLDISGKSVLVLLNRYGRIRCRRHGFVFRKIERRK